MRCVVKLVCYSCVHMLHNKVRMLDSGQEISTDCRVYLSKLCNIGSFFDKQTMPTLCAITPQIIKNVTSCRDSRTAKSGNDC